MRLSPAFGYALTALVIGARVDGALTVGGQTCGLRRLLGKKA